MLALLLCLFPRTANAVEAYTVENLDITIQVQEDGKLLVFEEYDLNFNYYRSSFTRNITSTYHIPVTTTQGVVYRDYYFPVRDFRAIGCCRSNATRTVRSSRWAKKECN